MIKVFNESLKVGHGPDEAIEYLTKLGDTFEVIVSKTRDGIRSFPTKKYMFNINNIDRAIRDHSTAINNDTEFMKYDNGISYSNIDKYGTKTSVDIHVV